MKQYKVSINVAKIVKGKNKEECYNQITDSFILNMIGEPTITPLNCFKCDKIVSGRFRVDDKPCCGDCAKEVEDVIA